MAPTRCHRLSSGTHPVDDGPATPWSTAHDSVLVQAAGATVAVFAVMLDFDFIERGSKDGRPKNMEWMAG